ncbi:MAG: ribonuclease J [bacterium]
MIIKVLDGHNVIGGNKVFVGGKEYGVILDFGLNFSSWGMYFEEFVAPRTGLIVKDLLRLNLIPRIDIYRKDLTIGLELPKPPREILFTFISHAHMDHMGLIGLMREDIPILSTSETLALIMALNEIHTDEKSSLKIEDRISGKYPIRKDVMIKGRNQRNKNLKKRCLIHTRDINILSLPFLEEDSKEAFEEIGLEYSPISNLTNAKIFPVYHSVVGSSSLYFEIDGIKVLYTGDLRESPSLQEERILQEIGEYRANLARSTKNMIDTIKGKIDLLIVEGTRIGSENSHSEVTEGILYSNIYNEVKNNSRRLIIADFPLRHLERFHTFLKIAKDQMRFLVVLPKDYLLLKALALVNSEWKLEENFFHYLRIFHQGKGEWKGLEGRLLRGELFNDVPIENLIITPQEIEKNKGQFILNLGYFEFPNLLDFTSETLDGAIYIHSNSEAYTEEQNIDFNRLLNWLEFFHIVPKGIRKENGKLTFDNTYHASGHISPMALEELIEELNPTFIVPIHTLVPEWFERKWGKKVYLNSDIILG